MNILLRPISLSEARRRLSSLLREIDSHPDIGYRIQVHNRPVAELRSAGPVPGRMNPGAALLKAAERVSRGRPLRPRSRKESVSKNYKEVLYGKDALLRSPGDR